jgi:MFS family permease
MIDLLERTKEFINKIDKRIKVAIAGSSLNTWGTRFTSQYNLLFASSLGANSFQIGLLNSIVGAVGSLASIPLGWAIEKYSARRVIIIGYAFSAIAAAIFALANKWWMLIPAFIIGTKLIRIMPLTDIIFVSIIEPEQRASIISVSRVTSGVLNIFAPYAAALIVAYFGGINAIGIRPLYYIQFVILSLVFVYVWKKLGPLPGETGEISDDTHINVRSLWREYRDFIMKEKWMKRWTALRIVRQFGMNIALPFVPLWLVNVKGASPQVLGLMGTVGVIVALVLQIPVGRLSDKIGRKKVYFLLRPAAYLGTMVLIVAPDPKYLILVGLFGAVAMGANASGGGISQVSNTPFVTMFWESIPKEKRGKGFGVEGVMGLSAIPASIIGGLMWESGLMVEVLLLPLLLELFIALPILATIPDTYIKHTDQR